MTTKLLERIDEHFLQATPSEGNRFWYQEGYIDALQWVKATVFQLLAEEATQ
jgi:deoxyribodipyrimidine photolyase-like uncharacterized protein